MSTRSSYSISIPGGHRSEVLRHAKKSVLKTQRHQPHFVRKLYHLINGLLCFSLYAYVLTREQALFLITLVGGIWVAFDILRFRVPVINALTFRYFGKLMRREELKGISANSFYIIGLFVVVLFFPKNIALLSVLFLAIGDPIAAIVGTSIGKHTLIRGKSIEGAIANFLFTTLATAVVGNFYYHLKTDHVLILALVGGVISTLAELCPLEINDNLSIPILSSVLLSIFLGIFPLI